MKYQLNQCYKQLYYINVSACSMRFFSRGFWSTFTSHNHFWLIIRQTRCISHWSEYGYDDWDGVILVHSIHEWHWTEPMVVMKYSTLNKNRVWRSDPTDFHLFNECMFLFHFSSFSSFCIETLASYRWKEKKTRQTTAKSIPRRTKNLEHGANGVRCECKYIKCNVWVVEIQFWLRKAFFILCLVRCLYNQESKIFLWCLAWSVLILVLFSFGLISIFGWFPFWSLQKFQNIAQYSATHAHMWHRNDSLEYMDRYEEHENQ